MTGLTGGGTRAEFFGGPHHGVVLRLSATPAVVVLYRDGTAGEYLRVDGPDGRYLGGYAWRAPEGPEAPTVTDAGTGERVARSWG